MPILQYYCKKCEREFDELVKRHTDEVKCPDCGELCERLYSGKVFSATGKPVKKCSGHCSTCDGCK